MTNERTATDLIRCWPIILLPICIYHFFYLQRRVPLLIRSSVGLYHPTLSIYIGQVLYILVQRVYYILWDLCTG